MWKDNREKRINIHQSDQRFKQVVNEWGNSKKKL
jgi:hypothetical protein